MKNSIFNFLTICAFTLVVQTFHAQPAGGLWVGSRSATGEAKAVHAALQKGFDAFAPGGNVEAGWALYTDDATEVDPAGNITHGKKALREGWDGFMKMADETPKFSYDNVQVRLLTNDVALAVFDSEADIKIQGQQMGGKTKGSAVLRKINGAWKLEFDQITPMLGMPALDASSKN